MKIIIAIAMLTSSSGFSQSIIPLYEERIPNSRNNITNEEYTELREDGTTIVSKISTPSLTVFLPLKEKANGTAIIICPGGGYWINAIKHEGYDVARKFNEMGITAFVLKYRIPNEATMEHKEIGPLQDAQQAINLVRKRAKEWYVNPYRIGLMGFSAGGHLAATAGTHFKTAVVPGLEKENLRPDFLILVYPVISFQDGLTHMGSRDQLLGKNPLQDKVDLYSNELQVTSQTPPAFIVHASDDTAVKPLNSTVFYSSLVNNNVPAELHIYQKGGHGFGMNNKTTNDDWMERCKNWLGANGWLTK